MTKFSDWIVITHRSTAVPPDTKVQVMWNDQSVEYAERIQGVLPAEEYIREGRWISDAVFAYRRVIEPPIKDTVAVLTDENERMSYAPERVGLRANERGQWVVCRPVIDEAPYATYIRADKHAELEAENKRLRVLLDKTLTDLDQIAAKNK